MTKPVEITGVTVATRIKSEHLAVGKLILKSDYANFEKDGLPYWMRYILATETGIIYTNIVSGHCDGHIESCRADTMRTWGGGYFEISEEEAQKLRVQVALVCLERQILTTVDVRKYFDR